jgi:hypothetical protein
MADMMQKDNPNNKHHQDYQRREESAQERS